jgi:hypothetical protein
MVERLRALLERPLAPAVGRAILVLALATSLGFAAVALLGGAGGRPGGDAPRRRPAIARLPVSESADSDPSPLSQRVARQDAQDRQGTSAHRLAIRELAAHRALQDVPWHRGGVSIELVGVKGAKAALAVEGPSILAARRGWGGFLRRHRDDGRSYLPRFRAPRRGGRP